MAVRLFAFGAGAALGGGGLVSWSPFVGSCAVGGAALTALRLSDPKSPRRSARFIDLVSGGCFGVAATLLFSSSSKGWEALVQREPSQLLFASYEAVSTVGFGVGLSSELYNLASRIEEGDRSAWLVCERVAALFRALCGGGSLRFALVEVGGSIFVPGGEWIFEPAWREGVESDHLLRGVNLWIDRHKGLEEADLNRFIGLVASTSNLPFERLEEREKGKIRSFIDRELEALKLPELKGDDGGELLEAHEAFKKRFLLLKNLVERTSTSSEKFEELKRQFGESGYQSEIERHQSEHDPDHDLYSVLNLTAKYYDQLALYFGLSSNHDVAGHLRKIGINKNWVLVKFKEFKAPEKDYDAARYNWLLQHLNPPIPPFERVWRGGATLLYHTLTLSGAAISLATAPLLYIAGAAFGILTNHLPSFPPEEERSTASLGDAFRASPPFILALSGLPSLHLGRGTLQERAYYFSRLPALLQMRTLSAELCQDCLAVQCGRWGAFARGWLAGGELRRQFFKTKS